MKKSQPSVWRSVALLILCANLLCSCALIRLKHNVQQIDQRGVISVKVITSSTNGATYALAWPSTSHLTNEMVGFQPVGPGGLAVFLLLHNREYNVGAFTDPNGDGKYEPGEPVAILRHISPVPLSQIVARTAPLILTLSPTNHLPVGQDLALPPENKTLGEALPVKLGDIADLDDPKFSAAAGEMGMWQPLDFLRQYGMGVYFLEPYDPHKLPVLFVYGISGSLQDWRPLLARLDHHKYQPWLLQYPNGLRLDKSANGLASVMLLLKHEYHFDRLDIVAHSMGGLVARGAIERAVEESGTNFIPEFITISTPWGGHGAASLGVKYLSFPVPAWHDMVPGSAYLRSILGTPLPAGTRYNLFFSYQTTGGLGLPSDNDGVVGVQSELLPPVEDEAAAIFGLPLGHMQILSSPILLQKIEKDLDQP